MVSKADFDKATAAVKEGKASKLDSNDDKLDFYKYFKQATSGDVTGSQPWAVQLEARAKYDAWASVKGMSKEDAMAAYVKKLSDAGVEL